MATGQPKMTEMSKPAEILYRAFLDELRFAKQQQWKVTNNHLRATRARQTDMEKNFAPEDRKLVGGERHMPQWFVFAVLFVVVIFAGILAGYAIWQLS